MLVRNVQTGKTHPVANSNTTIHDLVKLGVLEYVGEPASRRSGNSPTETSSILPSPPRWTIEQQTYTSDLRVVFRKGCETHYLDGIPTPEFVARVGWPPPPIELAVEWKRRVTTDQNNRTAWERLGREKALHGRG